MPWNFPDAVTPGMLFTAAPGIVYIWNGVAWDRIGSTSAGLPEAPINDLYYGRRGATGSGIADWELVTEEAPVDGVLYTRKDGRWIGIADPVSSSVLVDLGNAVGNEIAVSVPTWAVAVILDGSIRPDDPALPVNFGIQLTVGGTRFNTDEYTNTGVAISYGAGDVANSATPFGFGSGELRAAADGPRMRPLVAKSAGTSVNSSEMFQIHMQLIRPDDTYRFALSSNATSYDDRPEYEHRFFWGKCFTNPNLVSTATRIDTIHFILDNPALIDSFVRLSWVGDVPLVRI